MLPEKREAGKRPIAILPFRQSGKDVRGAHVGIAPKIKIRIDCPVQGFVVGHHRECTYGV